MVDSGFDEITGDGLRVLLLGSYDSTTKAILRNARRNLNERFTRYACYTILLENLEVWVSHTIEEPSYYMILEREEENINCTILSPSKRIEESLTFRNQKDFSESIGRETGIVDYTNFRKMSEFRKIEMLNDWADLVCVIKHKEETRGGELVELTYLLQYRLRFSNSDPSKYAFFYKKGITISTMIKEMIGFHKVETIEYKNKSELLEKLIDLVSYNIERLNFLMDRFSHFEK